jgi:hypothetical protein
VFGWDDRLRPLNRHGTRFLLPIVLAAAVVSSASGAHAKWHGAHGFPVLVPTPAGARVTDADADAAPGRPTKASRRSFRQASGALNDAADAGKWDDFLAAAHTALLALPEHPSSYAKRSRVVEYVGEWSVALRRKEQLRRAIEILEAYIEQLRFAYGDDIRERWRSEQAHVHLDALQRRLEAFEPTRSASRVDPRIVTPAPTQKLRRQQVRPLVASGAVLTAVGAIVSIAGAVVHGHASALEPDGSPRARSVSAIPLALVAPGAAALVIGIGLLAAGLDARKHPPSSRASIRTTGVEIRF